METPVKQSKSQHGSQASSQKDKSARSGGNSGASTAVTGGEFIVAKILGKKIVRYEANYHVKWEGYSMAEATWEPYANLQHNVVRARFDDKLKMWLRKHEEAGTANRISDIEREIAEWTSKQGAPKLKHAKNGEELRAERVDVECREFSRMPRPPSQNPPPDSTAATQPAPTSAAGANATNLQGELTASPQQQQFSSPLNQSVVAAAVVNGSATPAPTGLATPGIVGGLPTPGSAGGPIVGKSGSFRRNKRTSPYPEWVAVARKRLLTEKRNVLKIYSLSSINDVPCYKVQLDGLREPEYIPTVLVKQHHPSRVIEFYEDHLTVPSPSKNGKRIKLKDLFAEMQQQQQLQQQQQQQAGGAAGSQSSTADSTTAATTTQSTNNELESSDQHMPGGNDDESVGSSGRGVKNDAATTSTDAKSAVMACITNSSPARPVVD